jgi:hypothetical protein
MTLDWYRTMIDALAVEDSIAATASLTVRPVANIVRGPEGLLRL